MAYRNLTDINISLQTSTVTSFQGFGTMLFASAHRYFPERVRSYTSLSAAAEDLPTNSDAYKAVQEAFSSSPSPASIMIGRREANMELEVATGTTSAVLALFARDDENATFSMAVSVSDLADEVAVATAIADAIEADSDIGDLVVATASGNVVSVDVANPNYSFWIGDMSAGLTDIYNTSESATELLAELTAEEDDFYFFTSNDHSEAFVMAAAEDIEARDKMYFFSSQQPLALTPYVEGSATDILGKIRDGGYNRTKGFFHHRADLDFPEVSYIALNAPYEAGSVLWADLVINIPLSQDPTLSRKLSSTQKGYLEDRNAAYVEGVGGNNIIRNNRVASGEWISNIRGRDNMQVDVNAAYLNLLISQRGTKIPYTDSGIARLQAVLRNVLERYVLRGFIKPNYKIRFLRESQMSVSDKKMGLYNGGSFQAELQGGILFVDLNGTLAIELG